MTKILVTGALGQIGSELTTALKKIYGDANVITSDVATSNLSEAFQPYEQLNVLDRTRLSEIIRLKCF